MDCKTGRRDLLVLAFCAVIFFVSSSILTFGVPWAFNAPDENANAFFAETFRVANRLSFVDPANLDLSGLLHPRSVIAVREFLVPGSFLGLPVVYGLIGKLVGADAMRYLTPLLAVLAVFAWRSVVEKIFASRRIAFIASFALLFHPAFWYYSARGMMHNVPFTCWLIFAAYALVVNPWKKKWIAPFLAGACLALAVWFRTSEAVWIVPVSVVLLSIYRRKLDGRFLALLTVAFIVTLAPMFALNHQLYLSPFTTGYTFDAGDASTIGTPSSEIAATFNPFQPNIRTMLKHVWQYGTVLFPWMSFAAFAGFVLCWKKKSAPRVYLFVALGVSAWLFAFYGSWIFHDNPNPVLATIGTSYVRYWLPIFVLTSPFVAEMICWVSNRFRSKRIMHGVQAGLTIAMIVASVYPVFFAADGLCGIRQNLFAYANTRSEILQATEEQSVIIVDRADKFLWPYRRVVQPLRSESTYAAMPALVATAPLYYFGITLPQIDINYLNNEKLRPLGLRILPMQTIGEETLYRLYENP